jgi:8-oxo-dGTP pyrophosphatase MutT (NUDIX family)
VVLTRDAADGGVEVLLMQRARELRFMGGMYVFPGGAVHAEDASPELQARVCRDVHGAFGDLDPVQERAHGLAAIRETCEEAGLLLGVPPVAAELLERSRRELLQGSGLVRVLEQLDTPIDLGVLTPLSRWITPARQAIRFDTRFYVARAPSGQTASPEDREIVALTWRTPERAIEEHQAGALPLSPPTFCTLEDLAGVASSAAEVLAYAASRPPPCIEPVAAQVGGRNVILFPGDPEHPVRERALRGPTRRLL